MWQQLSVYSHADTGQECDISVISATLTLAYAPDECGWRHPVQHAQDLSIEMDGLQPLADSVGEIHGIE